MLRYLRRVDDLTTGNLRWGILTNGAHWRLYYAGARSVSEQFLEIDLAAVLNVAGHNDGLFALTEAERRYWLKVFALVFRRDAFLPDAADERTFHQRAIAESAPDAPLPEVCDAALVLLYRLLFILYAEDRDLLPVRDSRYDDYALRDKVRGDVARRKDAGDVFSETAAPYWSAFDDLCRAIDAGDVLILSIPDRVNRGVNRMTSLTARAMLLCRGPGARAHPGFHRSAAL